MWLIVRTEPFTRYTTSDFVGDSKINRFLPPGVSMTDAQIEAAKPGDFVTVFYGYAVKLGSPIPGETANKGGNDGR